MNHVITFHDVAYPIVILAARLRKEGGDILLGIDDPVIVLVYLLCIFSTLLCVVYGIIYWNKEGEEEETQISEELEWEAKEEEMEDKELGGV